MDVATRCADACLFVWLGGFVCAAVLHINSQPDSTLHLWLCTVHLHHLLVGPACVSHTGTRAVTPLRATAVTPSQTAQVFSSGWSGRSGRHRISPACLLVACFDSNLVGAGVLLCGWQGFIETGGRLPCAPSAPALAAHVPAVWRPDTFRLLAETRQMRQGGVPQEASFGNESGRGGKIWWLSWQLTDTTADSPCCYGSCGVPVTYIGLRAAFRERTCVDEYDSLSAFGALTPHRTVSLMRAVACGWWALPDRRLLREVGRCLWRQHSSAALGLVVGMPPMLLCR